jgi:anhydro-N-acetylmuramic acid kinase
MGHDTARLIAGAMSGTSADGVDVALTRVTGRGLDMRAELVRHHHRPYDAALRAAIFQLRDSGQTSLSELARLGREISLTYALTVNEALSGANLKATDLAAVAAHGQTLYHAPPDTIQWLDPALVAAEVGCRVVSDSRRADCAAGGQGAPLVPFADYILFRHPTKNRVLLNIGGIANLTWLKAGGTLDDVIAFDTGPGNCISDYLCRKHDPHGAGYDVDGALSAKGNNASSIVFHFIDDEYFTFMRPPPKSTDTPTMIRLFEAAIREAEKRGERPSLEDLLFCAAVVCDMSVRKAIREQLKIEPDEVIVSGGGTRNATIMRLLRHNLQFQSHTSVRDISELGILSEAKEAIAFALLAAATLDGVPSNVPSVTGAKRAVVLGSVTPRP